MFNAVTTTMSMARDILAAVMVAAVKVAAVTTVTTTRHYGY